MQEITINEIVDKILKPFTYEKYGKRYIGYYETEGALRIEGLELQIRKVINDLTK